MSRVSLGLVVPARGSVIDLHLASFHVYETLPARLTKQLSAR